MNLLITVALAASMLSPFIPPDELQRPTYAELIAFLNRNTINMNEYIEGEYVCWNFACDLQRDAHAEGIYMDYWVIVTPDFSHAIVAVITSDKGVVFIEPQNDHPMKAEVGTRYWLWLYGSHFYDHYTKDDTIGYMMGWDTQSQCDRMSSVTQH